MTKRGTSSRGGGMCTDTQCDPNNGGEEEEHVHVSQSGRRTVRGSRRKNIESLSRDDLKKIDRRVGVESVRQTVIVDDKLIDAVWTPEGTIGFTATIEGLKGENAAAARKRIDDATRQLFTIRFHEWERINKENK